jgi:hypothetical protein
MPIFNLTLHKTYYNNGFFNVTVDFDRFVGPEGPVILRLGLNGPEIQARIDRRANTNGTPRIYGRARLTDWFQKHFKCDDTIAVDLTSRELIVLDKQAKGDSGTIYPRNPTQRQVKLTAKRSSAFYADQSNYSSALEPMKSNIYRFIADQKRYFSGSYEQFAAFGGPCLYFHRECLRAGQEAFLSKRHVEMFYATLAAGGMHRMGDAEITKTKLTDWEKFYDSLIAQAPQLQQFKRCSLLQMSETEYSHAVSLLRPYYNALDLSVSDATIVVNSKALHHLFPDFIPPVDRQYTIRFFRDPHEKWRNSKGKFRTIQLPSGINPQFDLFHKTCVDIKRLADIVDTVLIEDQHLRYGVAAPKALDNAIVNYVRITSAELVDQA